MLAFRSRLSLRGYGSFVVNISGARYTEVSSNAFRFVRDVNSPPKGFHIKMLSMVIRLKVKLGDKVDIEPVWLAGEAFSVGPSRWSSSGGLGRFSNVSIRSRRSRMAKLAGSNLQIQSAHGTSRRYVGRTEKGIPIRRMVNRVGYAFGPYSLAEGTCWLLVIAFCPPCTADLACPDGPSARVASRRARSYFFGIRWS